MDLSGQRVALYGRMLLRSREQVSAQIAEYGGTVERDLTRRTHLLVVGHGALNLIPSGYLSRQLVRATEQETSVIGETRLAGILIGTETPSPTYPLDRITPAIPAGLAPLLNAFDLVHTTGSHCRFSDVETLQTARALLDDGHKMSSVVRILLQAQSAPPGRFKIVTDEGGEPRLDWGDAVTGLDGQGLLSLPDQPDLDQLFEAALLAEAEGRMDEAARAYALCTQLDRRDPIAPFNLANVLAQQGAAADAITRFGQAIARDPRFAEAYHNRAKLSEERGDLANTFEDLRQAVSADPAYSEAIFNLAQLELQSGNPGTAVDLFTRFLDLKPSEYWRSIAKKALSVAVARSTPTRSSV